MLKVDLTCTARSHSERIAVVEAVAVAPAIEQETDWLEWKSDLDISSAEGSFKVARSILGFGNRDPAYAATFARGCAYFLVGVEPGSLAGTQAHDSANVEQWFGRYVAHGEPQWSVDFLELRGKAVMFVTVEAPQWGDPIFTLQRGSGKDKAAAVFVRLNGKTEHASPQDIRRLTERAKRADQRVNVEVDWRNQPTLRPVALRLAQAATWAEDELESLRPQPQPSRGMYDVSAALTRDTRNKAEFEEELRTYAGQVKRRFELLARWGAVNAKVAPAVLAINNPTEINFPRTEVTLRLPGDLLAYFDTDRLEGQLEDLRPPRPWGTHFFGLGLSPRIPNLLPKIRPDGRRIVRDDDELVVTLPPIDVRPRTRHDLQPVYLVIPDDYAGKTLEIAWRATSTGAAGDADGVLEADVGDPVDADTLVEAAEQDS